jgi:crotonobetainyl-CoA:carnitine CoA-transferase CaiB-like acyl-CoA transferase
VLDLQTEEGRVALTRLAAQADVMLEAFRPGVAARLGIVPEAGKPDVVFLSISGFGQRGPYAERPCTDGVAQAFSGMVSLNVGMDGVWYASPIGWIDSSGNGEFAVALRSALIKGQRGHLFAGCGIVGESDPESELAESEIKLKPMLSAMGE